jgi:hypothetical protein
MSFCRKNGTFYPFWGFKEGYIDNKPVFISHLPALRHAIFFSQRPGKLLKIARQKPLHPSLYPAAFGFFS